MGASDRVITSFAHAYLYLFGSRIAARKLKHLTDSCGNNIDQLVNVSFDFEYKSRLSKNRSVNIKPRQIKSEITALCQIIQELDPKLIVEVGTASGGTLLLLAHVANPDKIIGIDFPGGSFGGSYHSSKIPFFKSFGKKQVVQLIRADSHSEETLAKVRSSLQDGRLDFLFIDGDHTYEGVKKDFMMYSPLIRKGGIVAFHDIVIHDPLANCQVDRFWNEIKRNYPYVEIIESQDQKWAGIGVLYL